MGSRAERQPGDLEAAGALVQRLRAARDPTTQADVLEALFHLANSSASGCSAVAAAGGIPAAVACLSSRRPEVQQMAVSLLAVLAKDSSERCAAVFDARGVPPLVQLLHSRDDDTLLPATAALYLVAASCDAACPALLSAGALQLLGQVLMRSARDNVLVFSTGLIDHLAASAPGASAAAAAAGVAPGLVHCMDAGSLCETRTTAAVAIYSLSSDSPSSQEFCQQIAAAGGIPAFVRLVDGIADPDSSPEVANACAGTLFNLAHGSPARCSAILAAGGVPALARLLRSVSHWKAAENAAAALVMLQSGGDVLRVRTAARARGSGSKPALLLGTLEQLLHSPLGSEVQQAAAAFMRRLRSGVFRGQGENADALSDEAQRSAAVAAASQQIAAHASQQTSPPQPPRPPRACAAPGCGATRGLRRCAGCATVRYCSEACSRAHWREHRAECRRLQAEHAAANAPGGGDVGRS